MEKISRKDAMAQGLKHYFTGLPCKREHVSERTLNKVCCACKPIIQKEWKQKNKEHVQEYRKDFYTKNKDKELQVNRQWCENNKDKLKTVKNKWHKANKDKRVVDIKVWREINKERVTLYDKAYKLANKDKVKEYCKVNRDAKRKALNAWRKANPDKSREQYAKTRMSRMKRIPVWLSEQDQRAIKEMYKLAIRKEKETGIKWHVDHIIPLMGDNVSGLHVPQNLQVLPASENMRKSNKWEVTNV
jgi:hypothetical protein